jgi:putative DNA primase/helicase
MSASGTKQTLISTLSMSRYHPRVPYLGRGKRSATLMAAVRRSDGCVTAVQVTFLDDRCDKLSWGRARDNIGPLGAGAVRLFPPGEVLGLAEGVEDALSATQLTNIPCWAVLGAGRLGAVGLPSKVREVHLFADDDDPGRKGAANAREHFLRGGRTVVVRFPPEGAKDWNDVLRRHNV